MHDDVSSLLGTFSGPRIPSRGARARVLVVDDEPLILRLIKRTLDDHDVVTAPDAEQALALIESGAQFDLVLSDVVMPGMSGIELWKQLMRTRPRTAERMVLMTGGAASADDEEFLESGTLEVMHKPFSFERLHHLVELYAGAACTQ